MLSLRQTLYVNAVSSGVTGLLLVLFSSPAAELMGVPATAVVLATGIFLVLFALLVFKAAADKIINAPLVRLITMLDTLWVVASIVVLILYASELSVWGNILIAAVAFWVAAMAALQKAGLKKDVATSKYSAQN